MDKDFFTAWFKGLRDGLDGMDEASRGLLLGSCARHCAESHPMELYRKARAAAEDLGGFFRLLGQEDGITVIEGEPGRSWHVCYEACGCDLVTEGYMDSPLLCDCSRQSLLYCLEQVLPRRSVEVKREHTVLEGCGKCSFLVTVG